MKPETKRALNDLVIAARHIKEYGFADRFKEDGFRFKISRNPDQDTDWIIDFNLPDTKDRDATLLHFRRFDQQNEQFSFHKLDSLAQDESLSMGYREKLIAIRKQYFDYLNGCPQGITPGFFEKKRYPSRGDIMRVVLNGALAHSDRKKRERFEIWARDEIRRPILFQVFSRIVGNVIDLIIELLDATEHELRRHLKIDTG